MRLSEFIRTFMCLSVAGGCLLLTANQLTAQELVPSVRWNVDGPANWTGDSNWALRGTDPPEEGAPGAEEIAAFLNGGHADVSTDVGSVFSLSLDDGTVSLLNGGSLTATNQTLIGDNGTLSIGGGSLTTDSFTIAGGTINLSSGVAGGLALGTVYPVATANSAGGKPGDLTVGGLPPDLPPGQALVYGANADGPALTVSTVPVLQIDRISGATTIQNLTTGGGPLNLKGYSLTSRNGNLIGGDRWTTLDGQGTEGWNDDVNNVDPTTRMTEYNLNGATTVASGASLDLGTPYNGLGDNFLSPSQEDFEVSFILGDLTVLDGVVSYLGAPNDLVLTIDDATGAATIGNTSTAIAPEVTSYTVLSNTGSLIQANFSGLAGTGETGWTNANPQDVALAELNLEGSKVFDTDVVLPIGDIFNVETGTQDLRFQYSLSNGDLRDGTVVYGATPPVETCLDVQASRLIQGDLNGDNKVDFSDFLVLSTNFNKTIVPAKYQDGDIDCDTTVAFADFLVLSTNFNMSAEGAAHSVPEPTAGLLAFIGILGMLKFRRRAPHIAIVLVAVCLCTMTQDTIAADLDTRFIRIHPDGPNNQINTTAEARGIVSGTVIDVLKNEDLTGKLEIVDLAGGDGSFTFENLPYLNGVNNDTMDDFLQYVSGVIEIPAGDWSIGFGSDDGGFLNMPGIEFVETFNENGATTDGDGEILFNGTRGHAWTYGNFTVPGGGITTGFEAAFFERGGGDSFEIAYFDGFAVADEVWGQSGVGIELGTGEFDWVINGDAFMPNSPADFNKDGAVNDEDEALLRGNFGNAGVGDINASGVVDFDDLALFVPEYEAGQGVGAQSVPEPASLSLVLFGAAALLGLRRRR